ncbi:MULTISPECIES: hypothetical protein [unclassified Nocardia]|uniref:hypothetical protein n=1 Tax=unclassified Nocardia TaxID=2637762 RepID=UPI001CE3E7FD|nr:MULTISPECIES: hypothetical protein [unclassified Nocardia]
MPGTIDHNELPQNPEHANHLLDLHHECLVISCTAKLQSKLYLLRIGELQPRDGFAWNKLGY